MLRKQSKIIGGYLPSFFEIVVDSSATTFDLNEITNQELTVFFHEYIHFLQDIATVYGLNNIYVWSEYLSSVLNRIYKTEGIFNIPFTINDNSDNVNLNEQVSRITFGDDCEAKGEITNIQIYEFELVTNSLLPKIPTVTIVIGEDEFFSFGALAIMENMAYIMERICMPYFYQKSPDFPYRVAEKVSDFYVKDFSKNLEMVLALCDMSLQTSNPGKVYVDVMKGLKAGRLNFDKPEDIYDHFYSLCNRDVYKKKYSFVDGYMMMLDCATTKMKNYIRCDEIITKDYYKWIDVLKCFSLRWRKNNRYFLLSLVRGGELKKNTVFIRMINEIGSPLITNNQKNYFKIPHSNMNDATIDVEYFKAIGQITQLFEQGVSECSLYEWCKNSPGNKVNEKCNMVPWEKVKEKDLCFYALLWKHWNLIGHVPQKITL